MRKLKKQGYKDMHPFILDLESRHHGALSHRSAGNRLSVSRKFDETDNLVKHAEVCDDTIDLVLPELVAFLQETSASGERRPCHGKCEVRGCEVDHNAISCILDSDADSVSEVARHALWTETSTSYILKFRAKQVLHKDRAEMRSPEQVATEKKADVHDEILVEHISPEMPPTHGHISGETSAMPNSSASYIAAPIECDVPLVINQRQKCPGSSEFTNAFAVESKLMLGSVMSKTGKKSDVHAKDKIPVEHISPEMPPTHGHVPGETSAMPNSLASYIAAAIERDVPPVINQRQECPGTSEFANAFEVESKLMLGSVMSETGTKSDVHAKDDIPLEHISPEMPPAHGHIPGETSAMPDSSASYIAAAIERDVPPVISQRQECPRSSEFANAFEVESKLMLGNVMSETGTKSGQILVMKQVCGDACFSAASPIAAPPRESDTVPYSSAVSLRSKSNSSTTSSKSFSFPLLPFEGNGSPLKPAKADRTRLQEQWNRPWWKHFVCCKKKYISRCDSDDEIAHKIAK